MKLLLDTHIFLWYITASPSLSTDIREQIRDPDNRIYLSPVSLWEALVKYRLGKARATRNLSCQTARAPWDRCP